MRLGVGLADFITTRLRERIDERKTFINAFTTGEMVCCKIPATIDDDEILITQLESRYGPERWMFIPNTLHLSDLYISEDLRTEVATNPICEVANQPTELHFEGGRHQLCFG